MCAALPSFFFLDVYHEYVRSLRAARDIATRNLTKPPVWQFVYLRDNKLSSLSGLEILRRVKVTPS